MNKVLNIMTVLVLMGGVIVSVRLVDMNQDLRSRASQEDGIIICHKTGSETNEGNTIRVAEPAVQTHLDHGDSFGECDAVADDSSGDDNQDEQNDNIDTADQGGDDTTVGGVGEDTEPSDDPSSIAEATDPPDTTDPDESDDTTPEATDNNSGSTGDESDDSTSGSNDDNNSGDPSDEGDSDSGSGNIIQNIVNNITNNNNDSSGSNNNGSSGSNNENFEEQTVDNSGATSTTPTKAPVARNTFQFSFRPNNVNRGIHPVSVSVVFIQNGSVAYSKNTLATHVSNGVFRGEVNGVGTGQYQVFLKTDAHLGRIFSGVNVVTGKTAWDFTGSRLIVGDFNNDNRLNIYDIGAFLAEYTSSSVAVNSENQKFDINHDGVITKADLDILLSNYNSFNIQGETLKK